VPITEKEAATILVAEILTHSESRMERGTLAEFLRRLDLSDVLNLSAGDFRARCVTWIGAFKADETSNRRPSHVRLSAGDS
jgi:hypothetical protein